MPARAVAYRGEAFGLQSSCGGSVRTIGDMRVFFTGGSGKAGRHAIRHLVDNGHRVVNGDLVPSGSGRCADLASI